METLNVERVRGETARLLVEMCTAAVEIEPCGSNIAYMLCGFEMTNLAETTIENPGCYSFSKLYYFFSSFRFSSLGSLSAI